MKNKKKSFLTTIVDDKSNDLYKRMCFIPYMPKRSRQQIEEDEKKILNELQKNANESIDAIARNCKFSRQKVWRSIKRLEHDRVIWGYTAIVDDDQQNRRHYVALIKKTTMPLDEAIATQAASSKLQDLVSNQGIIIENSFY